MNADRSLRYQQRPQIRRPRGRRRDPTLQPRQRLVEQQFALNYLPSFRGWVERLRYVFLRAGLEMRRRQFLAILGGAAFARPHETLAQKAPVRIGFLTSGAAASINSAYQIKTIKRGLEGSGMIEGRDYIFEPRFSGGRDEQFPEMARELAQAGVSVILANTIASVRAAQHLVRPVPVVMVSINDPVGMGLIASLARPGGHTTGLATLNEDLTSKLLEFQRAIVPNARLIAALYNPANPTNPAFVQNLRVSADALGMSVMPIEMRTRDDLEAAFAALPARRPDALQVISDSGTLDLSDRIAALALANRLPSFATSPDFVKFGGLMAHGASREQLYIRSAYYVKRILDGANPGDLPVEQPSRIESWINLKTAKALDLTVPASLLATADGVIE
jgi:putative ABC transport system substrate-binding protein